MTLSVLLLVDDKNAPEFTVNVNLNSVLDEKIGKEILKLRFETHVQVENIKFKMDLMKPEKYFFKDDGSIPNNKLPLVLYHNVFSERGNSGAEWLEKRFSENNWRKSWRNGVYSYHHYHSNTHEVLGVYSGKALLQLGGEKGEKLKVTAGDIIVIPAGVGHKNLESEDFHIVGAYPNGMNHDMNYGKEEERPQADNNIAAVPLPDADPLIGKDDGLLNIWTEV